MKGRRHLAHFSGQVDENLLPQELMAPIVAFSNMVSVIDAQEMCIITGRRDASAAVFATMAAMIKAFGADMLRAKTKFHALLHLVNIIALFAVLDSAWEDVFEAKFKALKQVCT